LEIETFDIDGVVLVKPKVFRDHRGFFLETYHRENYVAAGITCAFVQDNHSKSVRGTLRGLHYQVNKVQAKLVRAVRGRIFDVAVDIRPESPTFGRWVGAELTEVNHHQLFVPEGFAHGFQVLSETAEITYKCSDFYSPTDERGILWSDPDLAVLWPGDVTPILSDRDKGNPLFRDMRLT
jgi:dTDP-4-dehydrorhamnose 3,5-epimerase